MFVPMMKNFGKGLLAIHSRKSRFGLLTCNQQEVINEEFFYKLVEPGMELLATAGYTETAGWFLVKLMVFPTDSR